MAGRFGASLTLIQPTCCQCVLHSPCSVGLLCLSLGNNSVTWEQPQSALYWGLEGAAQVASRLASNCRQTWRAAKSGSRQDPIQSEEKNHPCLNSCPQFSQLISVVHILSSAPLPSSPGRQLSCSCSLTTSNAPPPFPVRPGSNYWESPTQTS